MAKQNMNTGDMPDMPMPDHEAFASQVPSAGMPSDPNNIPEHLKTPQIRTAKLDRNFKQDPSTIPHVTLVLPSEGKVYPKASPLSKGELKAKYMTGRHEDILTSPSYMQEDTTFNVLLDELVLDMGFRSEDLTVFDRASLLLQIHIQNLDAMYQLPSPVPCESCGHPIERVNLTEVKDVVFRIPDDRENPVFPFVLELGEGLTHTVFLKHSTIKDVMQFRKYLEKARQKNEDHVMTAMQAMFIDRIEVPNRPPITSDQPFFMRVNYCEDLPLKSVRALRTEIQTLVEESLPVVPHVCEKQSCGHVTEVTIRSVDIEFFFPS
jgi:hypothetical protein